VSLRNASGAALPHRHAVQFYEADKPLLANNIAAFLADGLKCGDGLLVISAPESTAAISGRLNEIGVDSQRAVNERRLLYLDAEETLARFMVDGQPDWLLFQLTVEAAIGKLRAGKNPSRLRAYGEMVGLLWKRGQCSAAVQLEELWNKLLESKDLRLFCGYPIDIFGDDFHMASLDPLLCAHTHLLSSGEDGHLESAINRSMDEVLGHRADGLRLLMKANYRPSWAVMPRGEAIIMWLRNNLPDHAEEIVAQAKQYYYASKGGQNHQLVETQ
jgi:hypothetical protein